MAGHQPRINKHILSPLRSLDSAQVDEASPAFQRPTLSSPIFAVLSSSPARLSPPSAMHSRGTVWNFATNRRTAGMESRVN